MHLNFSAVVLYVQQILFLLFCVFNFSCGRRYPEDGYFSDYYDRQRQENQIKAALEKLDNEPQLVINWPDPTVKLGQVSGVAIDAAGRVLVFHRGPKMWDMTTFNNRDVYQNIGEPPIAQPTILVFNDTGELVDSFAKDLFHMPHGITVDAEDNVWVTDVARHQVFKLAAPDRMPTLVLGEKFVPGNDDDHFCKPSAVAVLPSGDFFVADGYCNTRIIKFSPGGARILQWGRHSGDSPYVFSVPHALTLAPNRGLVCVADRERGRVACFRSDNGTYVTSFKSWLIGPRLFSVAYSSVHGGRLHVVNGPSASGITPVRGYVIDFNTGRLIQTFAPEGRFSNPHDIVTTSDGAIAYVAELNPFRVYRFDDDTLRNESRKEVGNVTAPVKPTVIVEAASVTLGDAGAGSGWFPAAGVAGGAAGAALLALAALALLRARNNGRKGGPRRRWEYGGGEFKLRRLLTRRGRFTRVRCDDSDEEPAPMLPPTTESPTA